MAAAKSAAKETGLSEVSLYFCNADPVETSMPQLLMNECKRLDSQNIIKVWWRSNLRLPSLICQKRSRQEILKSFTHLMLKSVVQLLLCSGTSVFLAKVKQETPIQNHTTATFQWPTSVPKRRSEKSLLCNKYACNMTKHSLTVTTLPLRVGTSCPIS